MYKTIWKLIKTDKDYRTAFLIILLLVASLLFITFYGYWLHITSNDITEPAITDETTTEIITETTETYITETTQIVELEVVNNKYFPPNKPLPFYESILYTDENDIYFKWLMSTEEERYNFTVEEKAEFVNMSVDEFIFLARVIEAESDRSSSMDGRILIAATILNRVNSSRFPNTISGVLTQSGQFTTVSGGYCSTSSTLYSEWAIIEAVIGLRSGNIPDNILYFNCIGYNCGTPYGLVDGNYFMCA